MRRINKSGTVAVFRGLRFRVCRFRVSRFDLITAGQLLPALCKDHAGKMKPIEPSVQAVYCNQLVVRVLVRGVILFSRRICGHVLSVGSRDGVNTMPGDGAEMHVAATSGAAASPGHGLRHEGRR